MSNQPPRRQTRRPSAASGQQSRTGSSAGRSNSSNRGGSFSRSDSSSRGKGENRGGSYGRGNGNGENRGGSYGRSNGNGENRGGSYGRSNGNGENRGGSYGRGNGENRGGSYGRGDSAGRGNGENRGGSYGRSNGNGENRGGSYGRGNGENRGGSYGRSDSAGRGNGENRGRSFSRGGDGENRGRSFSRGGESENRGRSFSRDGNGENRGNSYGRGESRGRGESSRGGSYGRGGPSRGGSARFGGGGRNRNKSSAQKIDPKRFVKAAKPVETVTYEPEHLFSDFALNQKIKENLVLCKFESPTQIQDKSIPVALEGHDIIGIANTGTGKTAAFLLPILNKLVRRKNEKVLVIAPTRELAQQILKEARRFAKGCKLVDALIIGGAPMTLQRRDLKRNPQIIIGTPGRLKDHIERGTLHLEGVSSVVLDEVDRMLDMGFIADIRDILGKLPKQRQSFFFSATMSKTIDGLIKTFTDNPVTIMAKTAETSDNVEQTVIKFKKEDKLEKLHTLLIGQNVEKALVFCDTKFATERLALALSERGFSSDAMHGNKSQRQRQRALKNFSSGAVDILVATDVAARGIDVDGVTHVVNYDVPQTYDDYTHRIGRTGRCGQMGHAITFIKNG